MFIDTHCHLDDPKLCDRVDEVIKNYLSAGVGRVINIGCSAETSALVAKQAEMYESVFFAAGVHPSDCEKYCDEEEKAIFRLADKEKCVAIGEIGLDYYWKPFDKQKQSECFERQIYLASEKDLPVCVHVRDAMGDAISILKSMRSELKRGGVMHCYSGSRESAAILLDLGMYISFGGPLTFKNARNLPEVAEYVPLDRLLTETDSPYLAPEGKRGTVNEPANVVTVAEALAKIKKISVEELASAVIANAGRLFYKLK